MMATRSTGTLRSPSSQRETHPRIVLVGDPEDNHCSLFADASRALGLTTTCHRYDQAYRDPRPLFDDVMEADIVRFETPGRGAALRIFLLETGAAVTGTGPTGDALAQAIARKGQIVAPDLWHAGFVHVLNELHATMQDVSPARFLSTPTEIAAMFDKCACYSRLAIAGLPVPSSLDPVGSFDELVAGMEASAISSVFVKLRHGSAASGIVALRIRRGRMHATTTVEQATGDGGEALLFNSRRVRTLSDSQGIAALVNALCRYGVHVERWVPKLGVAGKNADLRVLVIDGRVACQVVRMSKSPITNLHLGGERAAPEILRQHLRADCLEQALASCVRVGQCFPGAFQYAVDLALTSDGKSHRILEVNAFGDLLKGVEIDGVDPYTYQLKVLTRQEGWHAA